MVKSSRDRAAFEIYPIKRVDVYRSVLDQLERLIAGMDIGQRLPSERELVEALGVSRVSVREALRALASMGKIEIRQNAGSFVLHPSGNALAAQLEAVEPLGERFLEHLVDVRAAIEDRVVCLIRADDDLFEVKEVLRTCEVELSEEDVEPGSLDLRFEGALARVAGNPLLAEVQRSVHQLWVTAWGRSGMAPGDRWQLHREHVGIFEALEAGDTDLARQLMASHVDRTIKTAARAPDPDSGAVR